MNKGHQYPQVRSRWIWDFQQYHNGFPPCWCQYKFEFYSIPDLLDPGTVDVVVSPVSLCQWEYNPTDCAIVWFGEWESETLPYNGTVTFRQQIAPLGLNTPQTHLVINYTGGDGWTETLTNDAPDTIGQWNLSPGFNSSLGYIGFNLGHVLYYLMHSPDPAIYKVIRDHGFDDIDTAPVTWNSTK